MDELEAILETGGAAANAALANSGAAISSS